MPDNIWDYILKFRYHVFAALTGLILISSGILLSKINPFSTTDIKIIDDQKENSEALIVVEVSGAVKNPGVYEFSPNARINDALIKAGGLTQDVDQVYLEKIINRAALLVDGQKIYIPKNNQSNEETANISGGSSGNSEALGENISNTTNINTASQKELEELWGIGPVTAQNIIEQRPYSSVQELLEKKILKSNVYERNKNLLSVY